MIEKEYPFVNNWRGGCWVRRPTGKADRDFKYGSEHVSGSPHKSSGMVRYTLDELGGVGWIVCKDIRRIRTIVYAGDLTWTDYGEITAADILRVVQSDGWNGARCSRCDLGVLIDDETLCVLCVRDQSDRERVTAASASAPDLVPF